MSSSPDGWVLRLHCCHWQQSFQNVTFRGNIRQFPSVTIIVTECNGRISAKSTKLLAQLFDEQSGGKPERAVAGPTTPCGALCSTRLLFARSDRAPAMEARRRLYFCRHFPHASVWRLGGPAPCGRAIHGKTAFVSLDGDDHCVTDWRIPADPRWCPSGKWRLRGNCTLGDGIG